MNAHEFQYKERQMPEAILVAPASRRYTPAIQDLAGAAYGVSPELAADWFDPEQFRRRIEVFPEGQWIALEAMSERVVGFTSGMRIDFDPAVPLLDNWDTTTGYG
ncbi:MAG: hypothetical protein IPK19_03905 [Chloroflexi bacterium]|nr:hypothetical protein [Chloroflexota bacterium]